MRFSSGMESFKYIQTSVTSQLKSQTKDNSHDTKQTNYPPKHKLKAAKDSYN